MATRYRLYRICGWSVIGASFAVVRTPLMVVAVLALIAVLR